MKLHSGKNGLKESFMKKGGINPGPPEDAKPPPPPPGQAKQIVRKEYTCPRCGVVFELTGPAVNENVWCQKCQ